MDRRPADPELGQPRGGRRAGTRLDTFLRLAREFGAAVVCTCIDEEGQARTAEWKLRAARNIRDVAVERYGLAPEDLLFDPLALPLSTGMEESRNDGIETIEGIRPIKAELPGVSTILGLSNVSFGLNPAARQVLNSVFLHECVEAGLDSAIVHAVQDPAALPHRRAGEGGAASTSSTTGAPTTTTRCRSSWPSSRASR